MARKPGKRPNSTKTVNLTVSTTPVVWAHLEALARVGFHGKNPAEVAADLLSERVMDLVDQDRKVLQDVPEMAKSILAELLEEMEN